MPSSKHGRLVGSRFRRSLAAVLAFAIMLSACTDGGSSEPADQSDESADRPAELGEVTPLGKLVLMSDDGSAFDGSLSVLTLTNRGTGEAFDITVHGAGEATQEDVHLPSGDYVVSAPDGLHHSHAGSHGIAAIEPTEITVDPPEAEDPLSIHKDPAVVRFALDFTPVPVKLLIDDFEPAAVALSWEKVDDLQVERYVLRLTEGDEPAESPDDGIPVDHEPDATSVVVDGLQPETTYTFTLFTETADGADVGHQSLTATTGSLGDKSTAHAVAPNTIVPDDHDDLNARPLGNGRVGIVLSEDNDDRHSESVVPGLDHDALQEGCHPGLPILVSADIAGDDAFYGVIESCPDVPPGWMGAAAAADGAVAAVVNTDVPLAAVVQHLEIDSYEVGGCFDENGAELAASDERCQFADTDGDGIGDELEEDLELDNVKVTLFWSVGDDFDLRVRCPGCDTFSVLEQNGNYNGNTARVIEHSEGDSGCDQDQYLETFVFNDAQPGEWTIEIVTNGQPAFPEGPGYCLNGWVESAYLEAVVEGQHVIPWGEVPDTRQTSYQTTFTVPERSPSSPPATNQAPPGFKTPGTAVVSPQLAGKVKCESSGGTTFSPGFGVKPIEKSTLKLDGSKFSWDIRAGVEVAVDPHIKVEAGYKCSLDVEGTSFQLTKTPVPVNLELTPLLEGSATGTIELTGPKLGIEFGLQTTGFVSGEIERCEIAWLPDPPCGITTENKVDVKPFGNFIYEKATLKAEGELKVGVGVEANLGIGVKNQFVTAKTGFALGMKPAVATVTGSIGVSAEMADQAATAGDFTLEPPTRPTAPVIERTMTVPRLEKLMGESTGRTKVLFDGYDEVAPVLGAFVQTDLEVPAVECRNGDRPSFGSIEGQSGHYAHCGDALCMDAGSNFGVSISTGITACAEARCYFNRDVEDSGFDYDSVTECPQTEAEAAEWAAYPAALDAYERAKSAYDEAKIAHDQARAAADAAAATKALVTKLRACAKIGLGAELSVDFVAEAFVLGWGKKRTYPIWDKEFDYPGAEFKIGECIDD